MKPIKFTILGQPVSMKNSREIVTNPKTQRDMLIKSKKALQYERDFLMQLPQLAKQRLAGPVCVTIRIFYKWEGPDLDEALILDLMADRYGKTTGGIRKVAPGEYVQEKGERALIRNGVYRNDRQVREKHIYHGIDASRPRAEIEVVPLEGPQLGLLED